jgi:hypothetical protein
VTSCEICGAPATRRCPLCGRMVCDEHFNEELGVCAVCAQSLCMICGRRLAITTCPLCGRMVCVECSVQVDSAVRICKECYKRLAGMGKAEILRELHRPRGMEAARRLALRVLPPPTRGRVA